MKKTVLLIAFIAVIAAGIGVLYFGNHTPGEVVAVTRTTPNRTDTAISVTERTKTPDPTAVTELETDTVVATRIDAAGAADANSAVGTSAGSETLSPAAAADTSTDTAVGAANTSGYADGTYSKSVAYSVPEGGREMLHVSVTLADGQVTALDVTHNADKRESARYQSRFSNSIDSEVVGESIDSISLSRVGGASLTTRAFNAAIQQIETEASA